MRGGRGNPRLRAVKDEEKAPRRYDPAETRTRVLEAAYQLFSTVGYGGTGTADIARAADVSEGSIFYHFGSKRALLGELGRLHGEKMVARMQGDDDIADLDPGTVIERCFAFCEENHTWEAMHGDPECGEAAMKGKHHDPESAPFFLAAREVTQNWVEDHIRAYNEKHGIQGIDPEIAASLTFTAVGDALHLAFQPGIAPERRDHIMRQCVRYVRGACGCGFDL